MASLKFVKIATVPSEGLSTGTVYFETSTGLIKVATSSSAVQTFSGITDVSNSGNIVTFTKSVGSPVQLDLSDVASAESVADELAKKLNIGTSADASTVQSYYGLKTYADEAEAAALAAAKSYTDDQIDAIPAAVVYKGDDTTITQSGTGTVTFAVGTIDQSKVSGLANALAGKAPVSHDHVKADITDFDDADYATAAQGDKADTAIQTVRATNTGTNISIAAAKSGTTINLTPSLTTSTVTSGGTGLVVASDAKSYIASQIAAAQVSALKYKGSCTYAELPEDAAQGDVWNVEDAHDNVPAGTNYAWDGEKWDPLAGTVDLSPYLLSSTAASTYATQEALTSGLAGKAAVDHTHEIADVTGLQSALDAKVPNTRTVNGKALSANITLTAGDVGAAATSHTHTIAQVTDLQDTLDAKVETLADLGVTATAAELNYVDGVTSNIQTQLNAKVPNTRTINGKALSANITIGGADVIVGGSGDHAADTVATAIAELEDAIATAQASGVTSFGGQTGVITVNTAATTNGQIKFTMSGKQLTGTVVGLGSAAYTASSAYDAAGTAASQAASALSQAKTYADGLWVWAEFE